MSSGNHRALLRGAVRVLTLAAGILAGRQAGADGPPPTTSPASLKLFSDSRLITLPRISVEVVGRGPGVVLVPGLNCSRELWRHTAERLRDRCTLHLVQVAGFAGEPPRDNAHGPVLDPTAEAIDAYLHDAKLTPATVIGHSLGGTVALRLAQQHPADVRQVLLVDALPFYGVLIGGPTATVDDVRPAAAAIRDQMAAPAKSPADARAAAAAVLGRMVTAPVDVDRAVGWSLSTDRAVAGQAVYDDVLLDLRPGLAAMATPVTLVYPYDAAAGIPPAAWDALYQGQMAPVPHKALVRVEGSRHFVMYDRPAKFDAAVDAFLK